MNRRLLLLPLLLLAIPAFSQLSHPTVIILDQSFSMSLAAGENISRTELLLQALAARVETSGNRGPFALISFDDEESIGIVLPYPSSFPEVLRATTALEPWGRSPILEAVRFGSSYAGDLRRSLSDAPNDVEILLLTDAEDDAAYLSWPAAADAPGRAPDLPSELRDAAVSLTVLTLGGGHPGATPVLPAWADQSGGVVIQIGESGGGVPVNATEDSVVAGHEITPDAARSSQRSDTTGRSGAHRVVAAFFLVFRWNMVASAILGIVVLVLALRRWFRRSASVTRHNALPTQIVLEVQTSLRRVSHTFGAFPITIGTGSNCTLPLTGVDPAFSLPFQLTLSDSALVFSAEEKFNINGVPRKSWILSEGDQIRVGKYRIVFRSLLETRRLPPPPPAYWSAAAISGVSVIAALLLFLFGPLQIAESSLARPGDEVSAPDSTDGEAPELRGGPANGAPGKPSAVASNGSRLLPQVYTETDVIPYFDADYLVVHAHPDDESLDFGVLLSRLDAAGMQGVVVLLTDGQSGRDQYPQRETGGLYPPYDLSGNALADVRITEARSAMGYLGVDAYLRGRLPNFPYNTLSDRLSVSQVLNRWGGITAIVEALEEVVSGFAPELVISPDLPRGPYEHFEHEATGLIVATLLDSMRNSGSTTVRAHLIGIDPLQTFYYDELIEISPWELNPLTGTSYRTQQMMALAEHKTQRDSSVVGIETRLAAPAEYYAVGFWDPEYGVPEETGIPADTATLSRMALQPEEE